VPSRQREGKQKGDLEHDKDEEMDYQDAKRALKAIYDHSSSNSSTNEHHKALHVMYGVPWDITSQRIVKTFR
jgi:hypothetical protein